MNIGNYYCIKTKTDKSGKIVACLLRSKDGREQIERDRESLITDLRNSRISVVNLEYSETQGKLRTVPIMNTETGRRAESSIKASLQKIAGNLTTKSKGAVKASFAQVKVSLQDDLIAGYAASFRNNSLNKGYKVFLYVGLNGDYYVRDSIEGDYFESYSKKVDAERLIYKMAQSALL